MDPSPRLSIVVPVHDEEPNLRALYAEIRASLDGEPAAAGGWEVVFVDDRSTDGSLEVMLELRRSDPRIRIVRFVRNFGQTAAMAAGFERARGEIVVTIDGDLQNDPADIPRLVREIERGHDIVAGWRRRRHDGLFLRRLPSWVANRLIAWTTGIPIHDTGCTLKAFRRAVVRRMPIYAEQHRFLPAMARSTGARVVELPVHHRPRRAGRSKYGISRAFRVFLDLFVVKLIAQFSTRPLHYFGQFALPFAGLSVLLWVMGVVDFERWRFVEEWPQMAAFCTALFLLLAIHFLLLGLLSELVVSSAGLHRRGILERVVARERAGP